MIKMKPKKSVRIMEMEAQMAFLETFGLSIEDCEWEDLMAEYKVDYQEYREWYLTCCA